MRDLWGRRRWRLPVYSLTSAATQPCRSKWATRVADRWPYGPPRATLSGMKTLPHSLDDPRLPTILLALASVGVLASALFFQFVLDYQPCVLCIMQRWPYVAVVVFSIAALVFRQWKGLGDALLVASGLALLAGSGIAAYHVGVEQHWWAGTSSCGGGTVVANSLEALRAQVMAAPVTRCDEVAWSLFGVSMAGYNVVISLGLAVFAFVAARVAYTRTPVSRTAL